MSDKNFAPELTFAAGPDPFSDAESTHDAVIFYAAVNESYARFLNECAIIDNEMLHQVDYAIDFPCDVFVNKTSLAPILLHEIDRDLSAHEEIYGAGGSMAETS